MGLHKEKAPLRSISGPAQQQFPVGEPHQPLGFSHGLPSPHPCLLLAWQMPLQHVALLKREPGVSFYLSGNGLCRGLHYIRGEHVATLPTSPPTALVEVCMESCTLGVFEQWVVFDFGRRPVLIQKVKVKVGRRDAPQHVPSSRESSRVVNLVRWDRGNRIIIPSVARTTEDVVLLAKYKPPALALEYQREGGANVPITRLSYRERMHNFLFREEEAEQALIAK